MYSNSYAIKSPNSIYFAFAMLWAALWLSLNAESSISSDNIFSTFHGYRLLLPYFASGLAILWIYHLRTIPKVHIWQFGALGYAFTVLISSAIAGLDFKSMHFHAAIVCAILITILGNALVQKKKEINETSLVMVAASTGLIFLSCVFVVFFARDILQAINNNIVRGYDIAAIAPHQFGMESPRPTGISRTASIIGLVSIIFYSFRVLQFRHIYFVACICVAVLLFYQARGSIVALLVTACLVFCLLPPARRPSIRQSFLFLAITTAILFAIWVTIYSFIFINMVGVGQGMLSDVNLFNNYFDLQTSQGNLGNSSVIRTLFPEGNVTSGRLGHWVNGINAFLNSPLFGLGGQADRFHIDHNVSNLLLYVLMCGGVIGALFAGLCVLKPMIFIWKRFRYRTGEEITIQDGIILCSISIFIFLSVRGVFENSYSLFNVDFLLAVPVIWHLSFCQDIKRGSTLRDN